MKIPENFDPANICGGVWVDELQSYVPVRLGGSIIGLDPEFVLWDYVVPDGHPDAGSNRGCLLYLPEGGRSPVWHIKDEAADAGYKEYSYSVDGHGVQTIASANGSKLQEYSNAIEHQGCETQPGDTFRVHDNSEMYRRMHPDSDVWLGGLAVLTVFPNAPFQDSFEEQY
jgi:hypothetical protein